MVINWVAELANEVMLGLRQQSENTSRKSQGGPAQTL
jgi:hypothetical protein